MKQAEVVEFYQRVIQLGIEIWVDGGWGVDALLESQSRAHKDLDIVIEKRFLKTLVDDMDARGYLLVVDEDTKDWNFVMRDTDGRMVDFHVIEVDDEGNGVYGPDSGESYTRQALSGTGVIGGVAVRCIVPEVLVKFHSGYVLKEKDYHDVRALCDKFGIELPLEYGRFEK